MTGVQTCALPIFIAEFRKGWTGDKLKIIMDDVSARGINLHKGATPTDAEPEEVTEE